jgi:hypothetical protein
VKLAEMVETRSLWSRRLLIKIIHKLLHVEWYALGALEISELRIFDNIIPCIIRIAQDLYKYADFQNVDKIDEVKSKQNLYQSWNLIVAIL